VGDDYLLIRNWPLQRGDFFTEGDINASKKVCVIGRTVVENLFQTIDPIGKNIRIKNIPFTVVGVLEAKGANMVGQDQDNIVLMPYTTVQKRLSTSAFNNIDAIMASARTYDRMADGAFEIRALLHERHRIRPGENDDFRVGNSAEIAAVLAIITGTMTYLLAAIASVSLLVGGVGIMNIMLVSVTERTREIGIRMAVGAKSKDILRQFLVEAILLSFMGGLVGVLLGVGVAIGITSTINAISPGTKWPIVVSPVAIFTALGFAGGVGLFFGYYPARRASMLDPIESLRYE
jgi:putative ABC transport system permease protein